MSRENMRPAHWAEQNKDAMELVDIARGDIEKQHDLHGAWVDGDTLKVDPYKKVVAEGLEAMQAESFGELVAAGTKVQYGDLAVMDSQIDARIVAAEQQLDAFREHWQQEAAAERSLIVETLPGLEEKLGRVSIEAFIAAKEQALDEELAIAKQAGLERDELFAQAGQAWPIPRLIDAALVSQGVDEQRTVEDEFPVDKPERTSSEIVESVNRRYSREVLADASLYLALVLAEEPGHAFTLAEIGTFLYDDGTPNQPQKVSALISNYELGKTSIIGDTLQEQGLRFQRGKRTEYDEYGQKVGACRAVFRAVSSDQAYTSQTGVIEHEDGKRVDAWETHKKLVEVDKLENEYLGSSEAGIDRPEWELVFIKDVREVIKKFEQDDIMFEKPVKQTIFLNASSSRVLGTGTMLERGVKAGIISRHEARGSIETWKYICMALRQSDEKTFVNSKKRRERAMELVKAEVDSYFASKKQQQETSV